ncbi:MAG: metallophosphoesterase [Pseudomonadota bacterium]
MRRSPITRRGFFQWLLGFGALGAGYAGAVEPGMRLRIQNWALQPPTWPRGLGLRIVVLADPHLAEPHMPLSRFERIVEKANDLSGDLVVLLGDYQAGHPFRSADVPIDRIATAMGRLQAPLGVHAILGNHDWWHDPAAQAREAGPTAYHTALPEAGVRLLENDALRLEHRGQAFWLAGIGDPIAFLPKKDRKGRRGVDDAGAMLAKITDDAPAVLMLHEPDFFPHLRERFALSLAGHTHGGQVRLFGWAPIVPSQFGNRYAWGPVEEDGHTMVVSGGLGCSILPVRFGMPPEITVVELC